MYPVGYNTFFFPFLKARLNNLNIKFGYKKKYMDEFLSILPGQQKKIKNKNKTL